MRGKESDDGQRKTIGRITPAYAGKRLSGGGSPSSTRDHPRLCGEKRAFSGLKCVELGSPPPMRGKADSLLTAAVKTRITPAYAGKSHRFFIVAGDNGDHPRLCGEKECNDGCKNRQKGSPPPMRGKVVRGTLQRQNNRITPAYAGKRQHLFCQNRP